MNNAGNSSFFTSNRSNNSISMSDNSSNSSFSNNNHNNTDFTGGGQTGNSGYSHSSVSDIIQLPFLSLTIIFAIAYTILVLVRPTFRANKLNWFTINVCITIALLSISMLAMSMKRLMNDNTSIPCRAQVFIATMAATQMMYSHSVASISRLLAIVYANKQMFRSNIFIWSCIGLGWLVASLISTPYCFIDGFACSSSTRPTFLSYYTLATVLILPVMIVSICNIRIFVFVHRSSRRVQAEGSGNRPSQARDIQLLKTMIITFIAFIAGWGPVFIQQTFSQSLTISSDVDTVFQVLPPVSMLGDVILLIYTNQPVRVYLWQLIVKRGRAVADNTLNNTAKTKTHTIQKH